MRALNIYFPVTSEIEIFKTNTRWCEQYIWKSSIIFKPTYDENDSGEAVGQLLER